VQSLLEYARQQLGQLSNEAEPTGYIYERLSRDAWEEQSFVKGAYNSILDRIKRRAQLHQYTDLNSAFFAVRQKELDDLRLDLQSLLGGRLQVNTWVLPPFTAWERVWHQVVRLIQQGQFDEARQCCEAETRPSRDQNGTTTSITLTLALQKLEHLCDRKVEGHLALLLLNEAQSKIAQLNQECKHIGQLRNHIDTLEEQFEQSRGKFNLQLGTLKSLQERAARALPWNRKRLQKEIEVEEGVLAKNADLLDCLDMCPEHPNLKIWATNLQVQHQPLTTEQWEKIFLTKISRTP
jgi:hypothetical protein